MWVGYVRFSSALGNGCPRPIRSSRTQKRAADFFGGRYVGQVGTRVFIYEIYRAIVLNHFYFAVRMYAFACFSS